MIQWTGKNLKEVIDFTGKSPRFEEWFKSWEEFETYVHQHIDAEHLQVFLQRKLESYKSKMVDPSKYPIDHIDLMALLAREYQSLILQLESFLQEQPELTQVPRIEQETQKKGWIDYGLLISEIGLHRSNAIDRIKETKERAAEIKRNIAPHDLAILGKYLESVGAEIVLCCLQRYCMDFMFTQDEVKEIIQQEQPEVDLDKEFNDFLDNMEGMPRMWHSDEQIEWGKHIARHFYGLRNRALEEAARHVYESWMGGTMDDVRRDMVELGKVLNARKEE